MTRRLGLLLVAAALGCSGLTEGEAGVVGIEVRVPGPDTVEVGESILLGARPLDKNGDSATTAVTWTSADPSATIDPVTGVLTGVTAGTARVQAAVGTLASGFITFAVVPGADTLGVSADSSFTVPRGTVPLPSLVTILVSSIAGPLPGRGVIYTITSPDPATISPTVLLTGGVVSDTIPTGADGTAVATLVTVTGATEPDSVVVEVRAVHTRGAVVPGSGQRFVVRFQP